MSKAPYVPSAVKASRKPGDPCEVPGCAVPTREGKPYCIDHIEHMPYAAALAAKVPDVEVRSMVYRRACALCGTEFESDQCSGGRAIYCQTKTPRCAKVASNRRRDERRRQERQAS
jgi:hypothetical protein